MNKKVIIVIVAGVLILGGGVAAYTLTRSDDAETNTVQQDNTDERTDREQANAGNTTDASIKEFLAAGENKKCTFIDADTSGTAHFASGQRMRLDYRQAGDDPSSGSMIIRTDKQYIWDGETKEGMTFAFSAEERSETGQNTNQESVDTNKNYRFTCESWNVDENLFTPPTDVTFQDFTQLMQQLGQ